VDSTSPQAPSTRSELESVIRRVIQDLLEMPITPHVRELRAKAVTYGRVINNWSTYPPTPPQVQAMHECVSELAEKVTDERNREVSQVSRKPSRPETLARAASEAPLPPNRWSVEPVSAARPRAPSAGNTVPSPWSGARTAPTLRPPGASAADDDADADSVPPALMAPRPRETTPTPALLRSRRSR
jgi:hypothetical protein